MTMECGSAHTTSLPRQPNVTKPADVLARIADHPDQRLHELLLWHWRSEANTLAQAA